MAAKNDITGDSIQTKGFSKTYEENIVKIYGDKAEQRLAKQREKEEYFAKLAAETKARLEANDGKKEN